MPRRTLDFGRHNEAGVRLYIQHWMCQYQTGFLLHPAVPTNVPDLKILDVACGTGIWLIDLSRSLPDAQLDGFDISSAHFPLEHELPKNVTLHTHDALQPVPKQFVGKYDVVHIGRINLFIRNENPSPLLKNFIAMLRPGGYIHWDELDVNGIRSTNTAAHKDYPVFAQLDRYGKAWLESQGCTSRWISELPTIFQSHGLQVNDYQRIHVGNHLAKPWTEMQLMANRDFIENDVIPSIEDNPALPSVEKWREMLKSVERECQEGLRLLMDIVFIVGKVPE